VRVLYRAEAAADLAQAFGWYETQRAGLGEEFRAAVQSGIKIIEGLPDAFPIVHNDVRRALVHRFPYALYYRRLASNEIEILACLHDRRNPRVWRRPA
jgi:plasmid stabilization system protein ParE